MRCVRWIHLTALVALLSACAGPGGGNRSTVSFQGPGGPLSGYLYRPAGAGPFKAMLFNHGSNRQPGAFEDLAAFYTARGFVFFLPYRTGHGLSAGETVVDKLRALRGAAGYRQAQVRLLEADNADVAAAVDWLKRQPGVDPDRIVMSGLSFGGIHTLLAAEKGMAVRGFVAFAPGAMAWRNPLLRARLADAVRNARAPVFLIQAANDFSTGPSEELGPLVRAKGPPSRTKLYPAFGATHQEGHGGFASRADGIAIWAPDVTAFIDEALAAPR